MQRGTRLFSRLMAPLLFVPLMILAQCIQGPIVEPGGALEPMLEQDSEFAATGLQSEAECSDTNYGTAVATLSWAPPRRVEDVQRLRVDVTAFRDGFRSEKFETIAVLPPTQTSIEWDRGEPGINYYWRVLSLTPQGWVPSETARYKVPICPVDFQREPDTPEG